jgi:hypothetical protein
MRQLAISRRKTLKAPLMRTPLWNPTFVLLKRLLSIIGCNIAPVIKVRDGLLSLPRKLTECRARADNANSERSPTFKVMANNTQ